MILVDKNSIMVAYKTSGKRKSFNESKNIVEEKAVALISAMMLFVPGPVAPETAQILQLVVL
jgi:hypothetical protein